MLFFFFFCSASLVSFCFFLCLSPSVVLLVCWEEAIITVFSPWVLTLNSSLASYFNTRNSCHFGTLVKIITRGACACHLCPTGNDVHAMSVGDLRQLYHFLYYYDYYYYSFTHSFIFYSTKHILYRVKWSLDSRSPRALGGVQPGQIANSSHGTHARTHPLWEIWGTAISLINCGKKPEQPEETHQAQREDATHANLRRESNSRPFKCKTTVLTTMA